MKKKHKEKQLDPVYQAYRLRGSTSAHENIDTPWGPEDQENDFQGRAIRHAGVNGTVSARFSPAIDEDAAGWESCAGSLGPDVFSHSREPDYIDPSDSPTDPADEE